MEDGKTKALKDLMGSLKPAEMQKVNDVMQTIGAIMEILPPVEIKRDYKRSFIDEKGDKTVKEYIAIFIEKPQKAKE